MTPAIRSMLVGLLVLATGCGSDAPTSPSPSPSPAPTLLVVGQVTPVVHPLTPPTASVQVTATFRDGCEFVRTITQQRSTTTITVTIVTGRDPAALCTQATVPTQLTVALDGTFDRGVAYTVLVNGVAATFTP